MSKTNSLRSHNGESRISGVTKMSGLTKEFKKSMIGHSKRFIKQFYNRKKRMMLKNPNFFEKF